MEADPLARDDRGSVHRQLVVAAAGIALAVLAPSVLWGLVVRTTGDDLARRAEGELRAGTAGR